jgi:FkbM family methyltransferase
MRVIGNAVKAFVEGITVMPGGKRLGRSTTCFVTRSPWIKRINRARMYNAFALKTIPSGLVTTSVPVPEAPGVRIDLELDLTDELSRQWYYFGYQYYEVPVRKVLAEIVEGLASGSNYHLLDVGANVGYFSLYLAALAQIGKRASVHAFEPSSNVFRLLEKNLTLNPGLPLILNNVAVCNTEGEQPLFLPHDDFGHSGASLIPGAIPQVGSVTVKTIELDSYVAGLDRGRVALVKMDCEGVEGKVLAGMKRTLERDTPHIVIEILPRYPSLPAELAALPFFHRYRKFQITDDGLVEHHHDSIASDYQHRDWLFSVSPPARLIRKN